MEVIRETERRKSGCPYLTESEINAIAEKAASRAVEMVTNNVYHQVGKSVVNKFLFIVGAVFVGMAAWLHSKGWM